MFEGFEESSIETGGATISVLRGGSGPPLLLLHGWPQTRAMWHRVAPALAREFTVVAPDLRGYGRSSKPPTTDDHEPYSKRAMARDFVAVMADLGFERFSVCGHDRGARCAYRLALDHPDRVERLAVLDIIPTGDQWRLIDRAFAVGAWHWGLLAQPAPLPELLIAAEPDRILLRGAEPVFAPEALEDYRSFFRDPATVHAMCEDYRAGATYDPDADEQDRGQRRIRCAVLVLWGARGSIARGDRDPLEVWRGWADDVRGRSLACGHYLPEEAPEEVLGELRGFFGAG
jgi:haloacetate dehalogenase